MLTHLSGLQSAYLDSIIELCDSNDIYLYLINMPVTVDYKRSIPKEYRNYFKNISTYAEMHKKTKVLDFSDIAYPSEYFVDEDHLNLEGVKQFSERLKKEIRNQ